MWQLEWYRFDHANLIPVCPITNYFDIIAAKVQIVIFSQDIKGTSQLYKKIGTQNCQIC